MINQGNKPKSLYLHVPFCKTICFYCDFCHTVYNRKNAENWLVALQKEIAGRDINKSLDTIYIGGGTPSALDDELLETLLQILEPYTKEVKEYTIEVNPETVTKGKVQLLQKYGINRISMGVQSSDDTLLKMMNRHHTFNDVKEAINLFHKANITNISMDLMYSLPQQTLKIFQKSIDDVISLKPKHISLYSLTIEENSVFGKKGYEPLDEDQEADMYELAMNSLEERGYHQYEISNFSLEGYESKHNLAYWNYLDFYGVSAGASGKENDIRYDNVSNLQKYINNPFLREEIILSKEDCIFENIMMSLRLKKGLLIPEFNERYGISLLDYAKKPIEDNIRKGLLMIENDYLKCTSEGYPILNSILCDFLP